MPGRGGRELLLVGRFGGERIAVEGGRWVVVVWGMKGGAFGRGEMAVVLGIRFGWL